MFFLCFLFYSFASLIEILPKNIGYYIFGSHENNKILNKKIKSFVVRVEDEIFQYYLPFKTRFLAAFFEKYREQDIPKTKHGSWSIYETRTGNFTIRLFDYYHLHSIVFGPTPDYDCSIKYFRIFYARNTKIIGKSKVFYLKKNYKYYQEFILDNDVKEKVDAIKLHVLDNWGCFEEICLRNYSLYI